jgi:hypothetical protein
MYEIIISGIPAIRGPWATNMVGCSCMIISSYPSQYMNLWLKAEEFSTVQVNELPTGVYAIQALASWLGATLAAIYPSWAIYSIETICVLFSTICMVVWNIPKPLK